MAGAQEEHQEQLKAVAELSSVVAGFLMISFLQFSFDVEKTSQPLMLAYAATAALTARPLLTVFLSCLPLVPWQNRKSLIMQELHISLVVCEAQRLPFSTLKFARASVDGAACAFFLTLQS